jgi:hypothetical protein
MTQITKRNPNKFLKDEYEELVRNHLEWNIHVLQSGSKPHSIIDGKAIMLVQNYPTSAFLQL